MCSRLQYHNVISVPNLSKIVNRLQDAQHLKVVGREKKADCPDTFVINSFIGKWILTLNHKSGIVSFKNCLI